MGSGVEIKKVNNGGMFPATSAVYTHGVYNRKDEYLQSLRNNLYSYIMGTNIPSRISDVENGPHTRFSLTVIEKKEFGFGAGVKVVLAILTLGISSAIMPFTAEYDSAYEMNVRWPNKTSVTYRASCGASSIATFSKGAEATDASRKVMDEACMKSLMKRASIDYERMEPSLSILSVEEKLVSEE